MEHQSNLRRRVSMPLETEVGPHSRLHFFRRPERHPDQIHVDFLDPRQRHHFSFRVGHQLGTGRTSCYRLLLFLAADFLLELLFLADEARLLEVALAIVWCREEPWRRLEARGGGFQPTSRSARKLREPETFGPSSTERTAASER